MTATEVRSIHLHRSSGNPAPVVWTIVDHHQTPLATGVRPIDGREDVVYWRSVGIRHIEETEFLSGAECVSSSQEGENGSLVMG